ncbi:MAG: galactose-1-phosphate uridylyltransferase [Planctomycetaceae bacterium]|nr:galactose-1-phosphate uridylyltransferase [Planctomycetaceae bacterium]
MSVLRFDETTCDWVIFAPQRALRPHDGLGRELKEEAAPSEPAKLCPFCPGNERFTPPEIAAVGGSGNWRVRVFANRFPALTIEENPVRQTDAQAFQSMGGCGAHEVIVETPEHQKYLAQQSLEQIETLLRVLQGRSRDLSRDARFQSVVIFKNHGVAAGTSLPHPHWQLIATPVVPRRLRLKHITAMEYFDRTGECLYCAITRQELAAGSRIIAENPHYVAYVPFASRVPFEIRIVPRLHQASFQSVPGERLPTLAQILRQVLAQLYSGLENPAFNLTIDDAPRGDDDKEYFLWHMSIIPRLTTPAGFELGSGMSINTVLSEDAAVFLRRASVAVGA